MQQPVSDKFHPDRSSFDRMADNKPVFDSNFYLLTAKPIVRQ